jgi:amidophosphoribosyltransferase
MYNPKEKCGLFGVFGHPEAAKLAYLGLYGLQHRGEESAGIVVSDGKNLTLHKGMGLVTEVFPARTIDKVNGNSAIGHVRYSTSGESNIQNAQPFLARSSLGQISVAHNGNLTNSSEIRKSLEEQGSIFQSSMDTEVIVHLMAKLNGKSLTDKISGALSKVTGAYSLVILTPNELIGVRDPYGFRPLCLGKLEGSYCLASESCAFDLIEAKMLREIEPGEILVINKEGMTSFKPFKKVKNAFCIFEFIYFARPDSTIFGANVQDIRVKLGRQVAREAPAEADFVMPIPDSGNYAALGFARESGIPFEMGIVRNHYIGRTFIQPSQPIRDLKVRIKLNPIREIINGKKIVVIEDSIVRGTTSRTRIKAIREAGAREIHMRVVSPPPKNPCIYGIDFPTRDELIASKLSVKEIGKALGLDSLAYISEEGLLSCMPHNGFCTACFSGRYPETS